MIELVNNIQDSISANNAVRDITKIIYDCAFSTFGRTCVANILGAKKLGENDWFDNNCKLYRNEFHTATEEPLYALSQWK